MLDPTVATDQVIREADQFINAVLSQRGWKPTAGVSSVGFQIHDWKINLTSPIWYAYEAGPRKLRIFLDLPFAHVIGQNKFVLGALAEQVMELSKLPVDRLLRLRWTRGATYRTATTCTDLQRSINEFVRNSANYGVPGLPSAAGFINLTNPKLAPVVSSASVGGFVKPAWFDLFCDMVESGKHVAFYGPPGVGKSFAVEHLAELRGIKLTNINGDGRINSSHLQGTREVENGSSTFKRAEFADSVIEGTWSKIDECNMVDADAIIALNGITARPYKINLNNRQFDVHKNFRCFLTLNPGLTGTKTLPESLQDRFFPIFVAHPDQKTLISILEAGGLSHTISNVLSKFAVPCWDLYNTKKIRYALSTRRLLDAGLMLSKGYSFVEAIHYSVLPFLTNPLERAQVEQIRNSVAQGASVRMTNKVM